MFGSARTKRTTYLLDETARARIIGIDAPESDSEHGGHACDDVNGSSSLSEQLFFGFNEERDGDEDSSPCQSCEDDSDSDSDFDHGHGSSKMLESYDASAVELIRSIGIDQRDAFRNVLTAHVLRAVETFGSRDESADHHDHGRKAMIRRNVVAYLRSLGYNAAICEVTWQKSGGLIAGNHEFIDVVARCAGNSNMTKRYLIELHFAPEFAIARPTRAYARLVQHVPRVFVGTCEDLKLVLRTMSDALKASMKSRGLLLPPWRKHRFVQMKWFGAHRRAVNVFPMASSYDAVKCRAVGFDVAGNGGRLLTARTR